MNRLRDLVLLDELIYYWKFKIKYIFVQNVKIGVRQIWKMRECSAQRRTW